MAVDLFLSPRPEPGEDDPQEMSAEADEVATQEELERWRESLEGSHGLDVVTRLREGVPEAKRDPAPPDGATRTFEAWDYRLGLARGLLVGLELLQEKLPRGFLDDPATRASDPAQAVRAAICEALWAIDRVQHRLRPHAPPVPEPEDVSPEVAAIVAALARDLSLEDLFREARVRLEAAHEIELRHLGPGAEPLQGADLAEVRRLLEEADLIHRRISKDEDEAEEAADKMRRAGRDYEDKARYASEQKDRVMR